MIFLSRRNFTSVLCTSPDPGNRGRDREGGRLPPSVPGADNANAVARSPLPELFRTAITDRMNGLNSHRAQLQGHPNHGSHVLTLVIRLGPSLDDTQECSMLHPNGLSPLDSPRYPDPRRGARRETPSPPRSASPVRPRLPPRAGRSSTAQLSAPKRVIKEFQATGAAGHHGEP